EIPSTIPDELRFRSIDRSSDARTPVTMISLAISVSESVVSCALTVVALPIPAIIASADAERESAGVTRRRAIRCSSPVSCWPADLLRSQPSWPVNAGSATKFSLGLSIHVLSFLGNRVLATMLTVYFFRVTEIRSEVVCIHCAMQQGKHANRYR